MIFGEKKHFLHISGKKNNGFKSRMLTLHHAKLVVQQERLMDSKDQSKLFDNIKPDLTRKDLPPTFIRCIIHLDEVDLADEQSNDASEDEGKNVKEDEEKEV